MTSYSVVIPTFNSSQRIEETIKSVLNQTHKVSDIILVDDCSGDINELSLICKIYPEVKLIKKNTKSNAAHSRNIGWDNANSDYVFFLDSDDVWLPRHAENYLKVFSKDNSLLCLFGSFYTRTSQGGQLLPNILKSQSSNLTGYIFEDGNDFRSSTVAVRKELYSEVKFDNSAEKHQDWDFYLSLIGSQSDYGIIYEPSVIINCYGDFRMSSRNNLDATFKFLNKWWHELNNNSRSFILFQIVKNSILNCNNHEFRLIKSKYSDFFDGSSSKKLKYVVLLSSMNIHLARLFFLIYKAVH